MCVIYMVQLNDICIENIFWYVTIFVVTLAIMIRLTISLNVILGVLVGVAFVVILFNINKTKKLKLTEQMITQQQIINPMNIHVLKHDDFVNFLYTIQDYEKINPQIYAKLAKNIDIFLRIHDDIIDNNYLLYTNYSLLQDAKKDSLDNLSSMIFTVPLHEEEFLRQSLTVLNELFGRLIYAINQIYTTMLTKNGYDTRTITMMTADPIPYNNNAMDLYEHSLRQ